MTVNLVGYLRVSSNAQAEADTIELQRDLIRRWAADNRHRVVKWCEDEAVSGSLDAHARVGLRCAIDSIESGEATGLVVKSLDRLARELHVQEATLALFWKHDAEVWALDHGEVRADDPSDPMRTAMRQMAGVFSQLERGLIRMRMEQGKASKRASGGYTDGAPPFGLTSEAGTLVVDDAERMVIERIKLLKNAGASIRAISRTLNAEGLPAKRGGEWHPTTVARVLAQADSPRRGMY